MTPFDLQQAPLAGVHLIEAGAGTGKTYTITGLYLRLIVERNLTVDQILVVTYTKAATEELKSRIRAKLLAAKAALSKSGTADAVTAAMIQPESDPSQALQRIQDALIDFDRAAIFTIHGFCQRVLNHFAFETGHLFEAELVQEMQPLVQEVADDFWRRHISRAPAELVRYVLKQARGPEALAKLCAQHRFAQVQVIPAPVKPSLRAISDWRRICAQIRSMWPGVRAEAVRLLSAEGLTAVKYGKCEPDAACPSMTQRQIALMSLVAAMDHWEGTYPLFERFDRFCQACIVKATKKKHVAPTHPFFELCDHALDCQATMDRQLAEYWRYLKVRLLAELRQRLDLKKSRDNILFFDDLLLQVHAALQGIQRDGLVQAIQKQYRAGLVDEFQDTDSLQYEIFTQLFTGGQSLLFMIGDPKQAIYSFRGADIFSYMRAREQAATHYTLTRNWRATPALIQALNVFFGNRARPFGYEQIPYEQAVAGRNAARPASGSFHLWYLTRGNQDGPKKPIAQQTAIPDIVRAVAARIVTLLSDPVQPLAPGSIAVLTRTHRQAQLMKNALARLRVPAVLHSAGSVFDSLEAAELALVLHAVAMPADSRRVRAALSGILFGASAQALCDSVETPDDAWQERWAVFEQYHQLWMRHGFYRMFSRLMVQEHVRGRLLALPDGERRLTNLLHLAELLHQASIESQLGPEGLLKWFARRRRETNGGEDEQKLRLESDAHAVRIITIHKSKGLQFDVVFCPFTWAGAKVDDELVAFHDPDRLAQPTLAIGPGIAPKHREWGLEEALAENLRLLYVAVTRARQSCYLVWGAIKGAELSAPAYLLHGPSDSDPAGSWTAPLKTKMAVLTDEQMVAELTTLAAASEGTIEVAAMPCPDVAPYTNPYKDQGELTQREFRGTIDTRWRISSFSALIAQNANAQGEFPDRDGPTSFTSAPELANSAMAHLFGFPKGAQAGLFFHDLLEHWDHCGNDATERQCLVAAKLQAHQFAPEWQAAIDCFLVNLARVRLPAGTGEHTFSLADVAPGQRVNEMEFFFPLKQFNPDTLKQIFKEKGASLFAEGHVQHLDRLNFAPLQGFMKGYIDMVCAHDGRYYLIDWKSNYLGDTWEDYAWDRLNIVMAESFYFLQSHLYALALDLLLRRKIAEYDYKHHFGGVFYLFLRGIQGAHASTGIHHSVPEAELITALKEGLMPPSVSLEW